MTIFGSSLLTITARVGYGARGFVYLLIGGLAIFAAFDITGRTVGTRGALRTLLGQPLGLALLWAISLGFACFATWRLSQAVVDPGHYGRDLKGLAIRAALGASAALYAGISLFSLRLLLGWDASSPRPASIVEYWVAWVLSAPLGPWMVGFIGLYVVMLGMMKGWKGWRANFDDSLACGPRVRRWAAPVSRFGLLARAVAFVLAGVSVVIAAIRVEADNAAGLTGVLQGLHDGPYGWILLLTMALGLASFGFFGIIEALYRRIDAPDLD